MARWPLNTVGTLFTVVLAISLAYSAWWLGW